LPDSKLGLIVGKAIDTARIEIDFHAVFYGYLGLGNCHGSY
jgi:hypothetical protein